MAWSAACRLLLSASLLLFLSRAANANLHIGCFRDGDPRDLPVLADRDGPMSLAKCSDLCTNQKYLFFGLQFAKECWCGNSYGRYEERPGGECGMRCTGQDQLTCGGDLRNNIYTTEFVDGMYYLGCYADVEKNRDLSELTEHHKGTVSVKKCFDICKSRGFFYFGVQHQDECWCGNSYGKHGARPESECRQRCKGDSTALCGGDWRNSVYATGINPLPVHKPSGLRIRDGMAEKVRSMYSPTPAGVVCGSCLVANLQHKNVAHTSETFKLADFPSKLAQYPAEAQEKLKVLQMGKEAKTTFEGSTIHIGNSEATRSTFFGMAERNGDVINVGMVKADVFGKLVTKHNVFQRQTCWRHWLFWVKCETRTIEEVRGYHGHEVRQIDAALMSETLRLFNEKLNTISV